MLAAWLRWRFPAEVATDAAHDALATAFATHATFHSEKALLPWLTTLAFRSAIDAVRTVTRRAERECAFVESETLSRKPHRPNARLDAPSRGLSALSLPQRSFIERSFITGERCEEIARAEGRTRSAVAVELHRICRTLREQMSHL